MTKTAELCTCGHLHAKGERCGAIVSGAPMLTYCACPGLTKPGEHLQAASQEG